MLVGFEMKPSLFSFCFYLGQEGMKGTLIYLLLFCICICSDKKWDTASRTALFVAEVFVVGVGPAFFKFAAHTPPNTQKKKKKLQMLAHKHF